MGTGWRLIVGVCLVVLVPIAFSIVTNVNKMTQTDRKHTQLLKAASDLNNQAPIMVDEGTRLDRAVALDQKFQIHYTMISLLPSDVDQSFLEKEFIPMVKKNACASEGIEGFFNNGVTVEYIYHWKDGDTFLEVPVNRQDCIAVEIDPQEKVDNVFRIEKKKISFRYPSDWSERESQLDSTDVLLYADDGSGATCNIGADRFEELEGISDAALENFRIANHTEQYFFKQLAGAYSNLSFKRYWRGTLGQKSAGMVEIEYYMDIGDKNIRVTQFMASTFADGRRITLVCNGPPEGVVSASRTFDYIRSTMLFGF